MILIYIIITFVIALAITIPLYVYVSKILYEIAKNEGRNDAFLAWIPVVNLYLVCKLANVSFIILIILQILAIKYNIQYFSISPAIIYIIFAYNRIFKKYSVNTILRIINYFIPFGLFVSLGISYSVLKKNRNNGYIGTFNNYNDPRY